MIRTQTSPRALTPPSTFSQEVQAFTGCPVVYSGSLPVAHVLQQHITDTSIAGLVYRLDGDLRFAQVRYSERLYHRFRIEPSTLAACALAVLDLCDTSGVPRAFRRSVTVRPVTTSQVARYAALAP